MTFQNGKIQMTKEEIISMLHHSDLPTVIVEGKDDIIIFRKLESIYEEINLSVLPVGGRDAVFSIYENGFSQERKIAFVADKDSWVFSNIPDKYNKNNIIFTDGFSIENDVISDGNLEDLLDPSEKKKFVQELTEFVECFAISMSRFLLGESVEIKFHPNKILDSMAEKEKMKALHEGENYPVEMRDFLLGNYLKFLRGKSLMPILIRSLSYSGRPVHHNSKSLMEMVSINPGAKIRRIFFEIGEVVK